MNVANEGRAGAQSRAGSQPRGRSGAAGGLTQVKTRIR